MASGSCTWPRHDGSGSHDAASTASGRVFVTNEFDRGVAVVRDSAVEHTFGGVEQPGAWPTFGDTVGVVDIGRSTLTIFDATRTAEIADAAAPDRPPMVATDTP